MKPYTTDCAYLSQGDTPIVQFSLSRYSRFPSIRPRSRLTVLIIPLRRAPVRPASDRHADPDPLLKATIAVVAVYRTIGLVVGSIFLSLSFSNDTDNFFHSANVNFHSTVFVADGTIRTVAVSV
jgi:hypothetical protein